MRWRSSSSARRADSPRKRSVSTSLWPIVLPSITPETESDSSTSVEMSASEPCLTRVISRRCAPDAARQQDEHRQQRERDERELPVEEQHRERGRDDGRDVRDDRRRGRRDDALHAADVVGDARLHLARARAREEREREPLEVRVDRRAQVVHDVLADAVREPRLPDADDAGHDRDRDHARDQQVEPRRVDLLALARTRRRAARAAGTRGIIEIAAVQRDQRQQQREAAAVRPEEREDAARVGAPQRRVLGALGVRVAAAAERAARTARRRSLAPRAHAAVGPRGVALERGPGHRRAEPRDEPDALALEQHLRARERIAVDDEQVGELADLDRADVLLEPERRARRPRSRRRSALVRRQAHVDHAQQLERAAVRRAPVEAHRDRHAGRARRLDA